MLDRFRQRTGKDMINEHRHEMSGDKEEEEWRFAELIREEEEKEEDWEEIIESEEWF